MSQPPRREGNWGESCRNPYTQRPFHQQIQKSQFVAEVTTELRLQDQCPFSVLINIRGWHETGGPWGHMGAWKPCQAHKRYLNKICKLNLGLFPSQDSSCQKVTEPCSTWGQKRTKEWLWAKCNVTSNTAFQNSLEHSNWRGSLSEIDKSSLSHGLSDQNTHAHP